MEAVFLNKFRSILTALGIIFGVGAVIAMMAIGNGARQEILEQIKLVGVNNIVIVPKSDPNNSSGEQQDEEEGKTLKKKFSPGLTLQDALNILHSIPTVEKVSPEVIYPTMAIRKGRKLNVDLAGINTDFFALFNQQLKTGTMFSKIQEEKGAAVCIIGPEVAAKLFAKEDPLGKQLKCGSVWLKVIGVLEGIKLTDKAEELGISDYNRNVFTPIKTVLMRYKDRSLINQASLGGSQVMYFGNGGMMISQDEGSGGGENQLDKLIVQVKETHQLSPTTEVIKKILDRRHQGVDDYEIKIPELLLKQEQKTKDIFNIVLGAIAGISLIVGGIGCCRGKFAGRRYRHHEYHVGIRHGAYSGNWCATRNRGHKKRYCASVFG